MVKKTKMGRDGREEEYEAFDIGRRARIVIDSSLVLLNPKRSRKSAPLPKSTMGDRDEVRAITQKIRRLLTLGVSDGTNVYDGIASRSIPFDVLAERDECATTVRKAFDDGRGQLVFAAIRNTFNSGTLLNTETACSLLAYASRYGLCDVLKKRRELGAHLKVQQRNDATTAELDATRKKIRRLTHNNKVHYVAYTLFKVLLSTPEELFSFVHYAQIYSKAASNSTGWSRAHRNNVGAWYTWIGRSSTRLLLSAAKFGDVARRGAHGFRHSDVVRLTHVHANNDKARQTVLRHLRDGGKLAIRAAHNARKRSRAQMTGAQEGDDDGPVDRNKPFNMLDGSGAFVDVVNVCRQDASSASDRRRPNRRTPHHLEELYHKREELNGSCGTEAVTIINVLQSEHAHPPECVSLIVRSWQHPSEPGVTDEHLHPSLLADALIWHALIEKMPLARVLRQFEIYDGVKDMWIVSKGVGVDKLSARLADVKALAMVSPHYACNALAYYESKPSAEKHKGVLDTLTKCCEQSVANYSLTAPIPAAMPLGVQRDRVKSMFDATLSGRWLVVLNARLPRSTLVRNVQLAVTIINQCANVEKEMMAKLSSMQLVVVRGDECSAVCKTEDNKPAMTPSSVLALIDALPPSSSPPITPLPMSAVGKHLQKEKTVYDAIIVIDDTIECIEKSEMLAVLAAYRDSVVKPFIAKKGGGEGSLAGSVQRVVLIATKGGTSPADICDHAHIRHASLLDIRGGVDDHTVRLAVEFGRGVLFTSRVKSIAVKPPKPHSRRTAHEADVGLNLNLFDIMDMPDDEIAEMLMDNGLDFGDDDDPEDWMDGVDDGDDDEMDGF